MYKMFPQPINHNLFSVEGICGQVTSMYLFILIPILHFNHSGPQGDLLSSKTTYNKTVQINSVRLRNRVQQTQLYTIHLALKRRKKLSSVDTSEEAVPQRGATTEKVLSLIIIIIRLPSSSWGSWCRSLRYHSPKSLQVKIQHF